MRRFFLGGSKDPASVAFVARITCTVPQSVLDHRSPRGLEHFVADTAIKCPFCSTWPRYPTPVLSRKETVRSAEQSAHSSRVDAV